MTIEKGDYFAVTRGLEMGKPGVFVAAFGFDSPKSDKPEYDRSHDGQIYLAEEVCGDMVAARCVGSRCFHSSKERNIGKVYSLNLSEVEVMTLTPEYLKAIGVNVEQVQK